MRVWTVTILLTCVLSAGCGGVEQEPLGPWLGGKADDQKAMSICRVALGFQAPDAMCTKVEPGSSLNLCSLDGGTFDISGHRVILHSVQGYCTFNGLLCESLVLANEQLTCSLSTTGAPIVTRYSLNGVQLSGERELCERDDFEGYLHNRLYSVTQCLLRVDWEELGRSCDRIHVDSDGSGFVCETSAGPQILRVPR